MTRIVVVSDNHGLTKELEEIYHRHKHETEVFLHCGDSEMDENHPILKPFKTVNGNSDDYAFPHEFLFEVEGKKILLIHGHFHSVKYDLHPLQHYAKLRGADIVFFGHTHYPSVDMIDGILLVNPGSILANRGTRGRSYCVVDINGKEVEVQHLDVMSGNIYPVPSE